MPLSRLGALCVLLGGLSAGCGCPANGQPALPSKATEPSRAASASTLVLSIIGTNDVHGHVRSVPWLGGFVRNLRAQRQREGGAVLLVDAGDFLHGTLASNALQGEAMVAAYNAVGYDAVAIGNHEFDFGALAGSTGSHALDLRGALAARVKQARFPILSANLVQANKPGEPPPVPGVLSRVHTQVAGVEVGFVGVSTRDTLRTTHRDHVADLKVLPLARRIAQEAKQLRREGATVVIVAAHAGSSCRLSGGADSASLPLKHCERQSEISQVAQALPKGLVDVIVAGHTHAPVVDMVNGIPIIESWAMGKGFGRIDLQVDARTHRVKGHQLFLPRSFCRGSGWEHCNPGSYANHPVRSDTKVQQALAPYLRKTDALANKAIGVTLKKPLKRQRYRDNALGSWFADALRRSVTGADAALFSMSAIRRNLPAGELRYGTLFEAFPFDDRVVVLRLKAKQFLTLLDHYARRRGVHWALSGLHFALSCRAGIASASLHRSGVSKRSSPGISEKSIITLVVGEYFARHRLEPLVPNWQRLRVKPSGPSNVRDALVQSLADTPVPAKKSRRMSIQGKRPFRCALRHPKRGG